MWCELCGEAGTVSAVVNGDYYASICRGCLNKLQHGGGFSSGASSYERRRQSEDYAQDIVQPYDASGPNVEFYRLYPDKAENIFTPDEIEQVKRLI